MDTFRDALTNRELRKCLVALLWVFDLHHDIEAHGHLLYCALAQID